METATTSVREEADPPALALTPDSSVFIDRVTPSASGSRHWPFKANACDLCGPPPHSDWSPPLVFTAGGCGALGWGSQCGGRGSAAKTAFLGLYWHTWSWDWADSHLCPSY